MRGGAGALDHDNGEGVGNEWYISHYLFQKP